MEYDDNFDENEPFLCQRCGEKMVVEMHTCPYKEDINGDFETLCNCCKDCQDVCLYEI